MGALAAHPAVIAADHPRLVTDRAHATLVTLGLTVLVAWFIVALILGLVIGRAAANGARAARRFESERTRNLEGLPPARTRIAPRGAIRSSRKLRAPS
jgi:hypothetical protein